MKILIKMIMETITTGLLFEKVPYETAISALQKIIDSGFIDG